MINLSLTDSICEEIEDIIEERRIDAETRALHYKELLEKNEEYKIAWNKYATYMVDSVEQNKNYDAEMKVAIQEMAQIQKKLNITDDMLKPNYTCKICNDTGYHNGEKCVCFKKLYNELMAKNTNINLADYPLIENIDKNHYNGENTLKSIDILNMYCEKFDTTTKKNIVLIGKPGTGKTYISKCFARSVIEKQNKSVLYLSAYALNNLFLKILTSNIEEKMKLTNQILEVDLLVIDDLGTEPIYQKVTKENLYLVLEERMSMGKRTLITTNLVPNDIKLMYDERIYSRLFNIEKCLKLVINEKNSVSTGEKYD